MASLGIVAVATLLWLGYLNTLHAYKKDKRTRWMTLLGLVAGGLSVLPTAGLYALHPLTAMEASMGTFWYQFLVVGLIEELAKFASFLVLVLATGSIKEPQDGIIQGAAVGLGFSAVEDIAYGIHYGAELAFARSVLSGFHMLAGALWGFMLAGAVYSNLEGRDGRSVGLAVASVVPIAVLHSLHNSLIGVGSINGLPPAMETLISLGMLGLAVKAFRTATARSPYRRYPYFRAAEAIPAIRRGLGLNPRSIVLHRRLALYLIAARSYRQALPHLRYCTRRVKHRAMYEAVEGVALLGLARGGGEAAARRSGRRLLERAQHALSGPRRLALEQELRRVIKEPELFLEIYRIFNPPKTVATMRTAPLLRPKPANPRGAVRAGGAAGPAPGPGRLPQAGGGSRPGGRRQGTSEIEALRLLWPSYQPAYGPELES